MEKRQEEVNDIIRQRTQADLPFCKICLKQFTSPVTFVIFNPLQN